MTTDQSNQLINFFISYPPVLCHITGLASVPWCSLPSPRTSSYCDTVPESCYSGDCILELGSFSFRVSYGRELQQNMGMDTLVSEFVRVPIAQWNGHRGVLSRVSEIVFWMREGAPHYSEPRKYLCTHRSTTHPIPRRAGVPDCINTGDDRTEIPG